jgi:hypothetical protein
MASTMAWFGAGRRYQWECFAAWSEVSKAS